MRFRYLRYFLIVAEEKSFTRAAARVHIEPSPLSRAIRELENQLGVLLLHRGKGRIRLTWPGEVFQEEARRILATVESARTHVHAASKGFRGRVRIGLADGLTQPPLIHLLTRCREEEPMTEIRVMEMKLYEMVHALRDDRIDVGFTVDDTVADNHPNERVWMDRLAIAIPRHHPLLALEKIPVRDALRYPLIMCHPERCASGHNVIRQWIRHSSGKVETVAEYVSRHETMMMMVSAGYGIGIGFESQLSLYRYPDVIVRQATDDAPELVTFALLPDRPIPPGLDRFVHRAKAVGGLGGKEHVRRS